MSKLSTTTDNLLPNPHAGDVLLEDFLKPMQLSQNALARSIHVPPRRINEIVLGKRGVSADTDLRLTRYFGLSEGYFLRLQNAFDLMQAKRVLGDGLERVKVRAA
jgi:antitoxin HigA-1